MPKLQELREQLQNTDRDILALRDKVNARKADKNHSGELLNAEERSSFNSMKQRRAELKQLIETEESASDLNELLQFEHEAEERSRRGPGGRFDPNPDDRLPGEDRTYGDRFGNDRAAFRQHAAAEERRALATSAWAKTLAEVPISDEERSACRELGFNPASKSVSFENWSTQQVRQLRKAAGFTTGEERSRRAEAVAARLEERAVAGPTVRANIVPQVTVRAFEMAIVTFGGLVSAADVMISDNGGKEAFPDADDTSNEGHQIDEVTAESTDSTDPTFGLLLLGLFEFSSKFIRVANSHLRDAPYDLAAALGQMVSLRIIKAIERRATTGAGTTTLRGILTDVPMGHRMAAEGVLAWEEAKRLKYSVDANYRTSGSFMMNDEVFCEYMLLSDDHGRPLLSDLHGDDQPRLLNRPVITNSFYPTLTTATADKPLLTFGDHTAYKLKFAGQTRIENARERFIEFNQTGFIGFRGADGALKKTGNKVKALFTPEDEG